MADFWSKDMWPPNSPDINPLDYSIWAVVENEVCNKPHPSGAALQASITKAWGKMSEAFIKDTCHSFRRRLETIIDKRGRFLGSLS